MSRIIKFRVWDIKNRSFKLPSDKRIEGTIFALSKGGILFSSVDNENFVFQQFTGLLDKNGKEIYEGDIVKYTSTDYSNDNVVGYVIFDEGSFLNKVSNSIICILEGGEDSEVIGNIFENPSLLSEKFLTN